MIERIATWLELKDTPEGPEIVNAYTEEELEANAREPVVTPGIHTEFTSLPASAHVDMRGVARLLKRSTKSIQRAIQRGDLPKPFRFMGKCVWLAGVIVQHLESKQKAALQLDAKRKERLSRHALLT